MCVLKAKSDFGGLASWNEVGGKHYTKFFLAFRRHWQR
jgi:hypothetical protein